MSWNALGRVSKGRWFLVSMGCLSFVVSLYRDLPAQQRTHALYDGRTPAGEIGHLQIVRRPELQGVWQPVLVRVPESSSLALAEGSGFSSQDVGGALVSLQAGATYRLRVSNIPFEFGEVYPTIELIDRMHPPSGKETRYPIPIEITAQDLRLAISGSYVTRVIYVEDPLRAVPSRDLPEQRYVDAMSHEDPLRVADAIGRPVAILRLGSLAPKLTGPSSAFLFGSPPFLRHPMMPRPEYVPSEHPVVPPLPSTPMADGVVAPSAPEEADAKPPVAPPAAEEASSPNDALEAVEDPFEEPTNDGSEDLFDDPGDAGADEDPFSGA